MDRREINKNKPRICWRKLLLDCSHRLILLGKIVVRWMLYLKLLILWYNRLMLKREIKTKFQLTILTNSILRMRKLTKMLTMEEEQQKKFLRALSLHHHLFKRWLLKKINLNQMLIYKLRRKLIF